MNNEFWLVLGIALLASTLTWLGAPLAERWNAPYRVISGALQFAAGVISALVAFSLMPPAVRYGGTVAVVLSFFVGGALFVGMDYASQHILAARAKARNAGPAPGMASPGMASAGMYIGILVDLLIDGMVIGVGSTVTLATGVLLALGLAISTAPLTFITTATARKQGVPAPQRRLLGYLCFAAVTVGALLGFLVLRDQSLALRMLLVALAAGFLIATVTQTLIPEAVSEGEPTLSGLLYMGGISLYALMSLTIQ